MTGVARAAPPFIMGVDSLQACPSLEVAQAMRALGYSYWGRYLENLTTAERDILFAAGFAIWLIGEARIEGFSEESGLADGHRSATRAISLEVPPKVGLTIDSEDTHGADADVVIAYDNANARATVQYGYDAELYVGAGQPLNGQQLYHELVVDRYMRGGSALIPEPPCGFAVYQLFPLDQTIEGMRVDVSVIQQDFRGRTPTLWYPE